ncbi:hypothetical protein [Rhodococcus aetherivorans]|uniref:hypothetical protein n=1 Tax=Rhodococcus aetherivorans TaxID=191292 RepID=UPI00045D4FAF|nr:hypothetical protein [Rhodococcus aetherivorans]KDE12438.1 hypothetical protein N505_0115435 [Rhodococcus aetherivorans]
MTTATPSIGTSGAQLHRLTEQNPVLREALEASLPDFDRLTKLHQEAKARIDAAVKAKLRATAEKNSFIATIGAKGTLPKSLADVFQPLDDAIHKAVLEHQLLRDYARVTAEQLESNLSIAVDDIFAWLHAELCELAATVLDHAEVFDGGQCTAEVAVETPERQTAYLAIRELLPRFGLLRDAQYALVRYHVSGINPAPLTNDQQAVHSLLLVREGISDPVKSITDPDALVRHCRQRPWIPMTAEIESVWSTAALADYAAAGKAAPTLETRTTSWRYA